MPCQNSQNLWQIAFAIWRLVARPRARANTPSAGPMVGFLAGSEAVVFIHSPGLPAVIPRARTARIPSVYRRQWLSHSAVMDQPKPKFLVVSSKKCPKHRSFVTSTGTTRHARFIDRKLLETSGIHRHKAWRISGLCSSDLGSAHSEKSPVPDRLRAQENGPKDLPKVSHCAPSCAILM